MDQTRNNYAKSVSRRWQSKAGFSLIELLVALSIVAVLILLVVYSLTKQLSRSRDAQRKGDLEKIKVAFEDYYNDKSCYPPADVLEDCKGAAFQPYLQAIPCDPITKNPYVYVPMSSDGCKGYRILTSLEAADDPDILKLGCDGPDGCGYGAAYNYGVAAGTAVYDPDGYPLPSPTLAPAPSPVAASPSPLPYPSGTIYVYACDNSGVCNQFEVGHPALLHCPVTFPQTDCNSQCGNPAVRCD